jgi:hypothetical protein
LALSKRVRARIIATVGPEGMENGAAVYVRRVVEHATRHGVLT